MNFHIDSFLKKEVALYILSFALLGAALAKALGLIISLSLPSSGALSKPASKEETRVTESVSRSFKNEGASLPANVAVNSEALKLKAIFKSGSNSFALFSDGKDSFFLFTGEIKNGVKLENILHEKAILSRGSQRFELFLEYAYFPSSQKAISETSQKTAIISKELLGGYIQNPTAMMEDVRLDVKNNGVFIATLKSGTLFDIAGFRQNDVILSLDNQAIKNPVDLIGALKNLSDKNTFSAQIDRNGVKKEMKYEIK